MLSYFMKGDPNMTVQELIDQLEKIEDKTLPVHKDYFDHNGDDEFNDNEKIHYIYEENGVVNIS